MNVNLTPGEVGVQGRIREISKLKCLRSGILRLEQSVYHSGRNPFILNVLLITVTDGLNRAVGKTAQTVETFVFCPDHPVLFRIKAPALCGAVRFTEPAAGTDRIIHLQREMITEEIPAMLHPAEAAHEI